ncbi:aldose 1-epimerase family protein [Arthrobacter rhombi]|uniref:aldose 1-epimerase family protein n=1 Tax=Arthrobacter rhombi TaxID=71253 RepID=UPI003F8F2328
MSGTTAAPTGRQFTIRGGGAEAVVTELAAALRIYRRNGIDLAQPFGEHELPPSGSGILLAPWGNRIRDGRWELDGQTQQLDLTEVANGNAIHGLLRNTGYRLEASSESLICLSAEIFPQHGFPFRMTHTVTYALDAEGGLSVTQDLLNHSERKAPAALGAHPYLRLGEVPTEELLVTVQADTVLETDERLIPTGTSPVDGDTDLRAGRRVGDLRIDIGLTGLTLHDDGVHHHRLTAPDGRAVGLWADAGFGYAQVFVTEGYAGQPLAVAIEPMTAPANAFNSGDGLTWLAPHEHLIGRWGIESWL